MEFQEQKENQLIYCKDFHITQGYTYIYVLIDPRTSEIKYVGKANNLKKRYIAHFVDCTMYNTKRTCWIKSLISKGLVPIVKVIEQCPLTIWKEREIYWIANFINLVNGTSGGEGNHNLPEESRKRISEGSKKYSTGRKLSEETKAKISNSLKGKIRPEDVRVKISNSVKNNHPRKGKQLSPEHKARIAEALKGNKNQNWYKRLKP